MHPNPIRFYGKEFDMLHRLTMVVLEATLCAFKIVDTTRRKLRNDYPAMRGTSAAHDWRDAER